jgi:hypothetical protein
MLFMYLVSTTELNQFLKLPILIEHYQEHHKLNPEMSLLAFFKTHYDHPVKDADYKTDRKLPFIIHSTPLNLIFTINQVFKLEERNIFFGHITREKIASSDNDFFFKGYLHSIWQPPRLA